MMLDILLPVLPGGAAKVLRWLVEEGARVAAGTPLVIVLTEQVEALLPAPAAGILAERSAEGTLIEANALLGRLAVNDPTPKITAGAQPPGETSSPAGPRLLATPLARRIARSHQIDLASLVGSGPHGCIRAADVRRMLAVTPILPPLPHSPTPSLASSPNLPIATATVECDAGPTLARIEMRRASYERLGLVPGLCGSVIAAAAALLPAHALLNACWSEDGIMLRRRVHIAAAQPCANGQLRWSSVADAGDLTDRGIVRALAARPLSAPDATFAVICLAGSGWLSAPPLLAGTAAALVVGAAASQIVVVGDGVAVRPIALLSLCYDARVLDHRAAVAFLVAVKAMLEAGD